MGIAQGLARRLIVAALAVASTTAFALALAGCGDDTANKPLRRIYLSVPQQGALAARGDDMEDAARLALEQSDYDTPDVRIELKIVDSADEKHSRSILDAIGDKLAMAYITEGGQHERDDGWGMSTDRALLGISLAPSVKGSDFTSVPGLETIHLLPDAADTGAALAQAVADDAPTAITLNVGSSAFARSAAAGFREAIATADLNVRETRGGTGLNAVVEVGGKQVVYGTDRPQAPNPGSDGRLVTPALPPAGYPPNGERFFEWFEDAYDRKPDRWAIWAYEATGLALNAITDAGAGEIGPTERMNYVPAPATGPAGVNRDAVRYSAVAITDRFGPVGHYDILPSRQTTLYTFAVRPWPFDEAAEADDPRVIEVNR